MKEELKFFEAANHEFFDPAASPLDQTELLPYNASYNIEKTRLIFGVYFSALFNNILIEHEITLTKSQNLAYKLIDSLLTISI